MDKKQRKRRAAVAATALLEWRDRMAREEARNRMAKEIAEREMTTRYERTVAEMRTQLEERPRAASQTTCTMVAGMVNGAGATGALK
jgi:hypothetical protein